MLRSVTERVKLERILRGINEGDWNPNWLVIGHEDLCGDPIFVDLSHSTLPVFTAAHGQDRWDKELLASTFGGFVLALNEVDRISKNRRNPVELKRNPLSPGEKETLLRQIAAMTESSNLEFGRAGSKFERRNMEVAAVTTKQTTP